MDITRRAKLAKKQAENCLKSIEYQAKFAKNNALAQANAQMTEFAQELYNSNGLDPSTSIDMSTLDDEQKKALTQIQQQITNFNAQVQQQLSAYNNQVDLWSENMKQLQYEPLRQEDELLAEEKERKEDDLAMAKEEYEKAKPAVKEEIKNIIPTFGNG